MDKVERFAFLLQRDKVLLVEMFVYFSIILVIMLIIIRRINLS